MKKKNQTICQIVVDVVLFVLTLGAIGLIVFAPTGCGAGKKLSSGRSLTSLAENAKKGKKGKSAGKKKKKGSGQVSLSATTLADGSVRLNAKAPKRVSEVRIFVEKQNPAAANAQDARRRRGGPVKAATITVTEPGRYIAWAQGYKNGRAQSKWRSSNVSFSVQDTDAPKVSIIAPRDEIILTSRLDDFKLGITLEASDAEGLKTLSLDVKDSQGETVFNPPAEQTSAKTLTKNFDWNVKGLEGQYTILALAIDQADNSTRVEQKVTLDAPPAPVITNLVQDQAVQGTQPVTVRIAPDVTLVRLMVNGTKATEQEVKKAKLSPLKKTKKANRAEAELSFTLNWDTTKHPNGEVKVQAQADDAAGQTGASAELGVKVDNLVSDQALGSPQGRSSFSFVKAINIYAINKIPYLGGFIVDFDSSGIYLSGPDLFKIDWDGRLIWRRYDGMTIKVDRNGILWASMNQGGYVQRFEGATGQPVGPKIEHEFSQAVLGVDQKYAYIQGYDGARFMIRVFSLDGTFIRQMDCPDQTDLARSTTSFVDEAAGALVAVYHFPSVVVQYDRATGQVLNQLALPANIASKGIALTPKGELISTDTMSKRGNNALWHIFDPRTGALLESKNPNHPNWNETLGVAIHGSRMVLTGYVRQGIADEIEIWDVR